MALIKDFSVFDKYNRKPCAICNAEATSTYISSKNHDLNDNLISLCRVHKARLEESGMNSFVKRYPKMALILIKKGFKFSKESLLWENYDITGDEYDSE